MIGLSKLCFISKNLSLLFLKQLNDLLISSKRIFSAVIISSIIGFVNSHDNFNELFIILYVFSEISTYSEAAFENLFSFLSINFKSFLLLFLFILEILLS